MEREHRPRETESQYLRGQAWGHYAYAHCLAHQAINAKLEGDTERRMWTLMESHKELTRALDLWRRAKMWERMNGT